MLVVFGIVYDIIRSMRGKRCNACFGGRERSHIKIVALASDTLS